MEQVTKPNNIFLSPHGTIVKREALLTASSSATAISFMPGSLVVVDAGNAVVLRTAAHNTAGAPVAVADISVCSAGSIHSPYVSATTAGRTKDTRDRVNFKYPGVGEYVRLKVTTETNIVTGSYVEPDGATGGVKLSTGGQTKASVGRAVDGIEISQYDPTIMWVVVEIIYPTPTV